MNGVFCIEGDWYGDHNRSATVKPMLELLGQSAMGKVDFIHHNVATREELAHHLKRWRRSSRFRVLYLAFHGAPGLIYLGHRRRRSDVVTLDDLAKMTGSGLAERVVHFGSCSTFAVDRRVVRRFLKQTGMTAATGFASDVNWFRTTVFEFLMLATVVERRTNLRAARRLEAALLRELPSLRRELAFRMVLNER
jgi:hypothetical protein